MRTHLPSIALLFASVLAIAQTQSQLNLMPMPSSVQLGSGQLLIDRSFSIAISGHRDALLDRGVQRFIAQLSRQTAMLFESGGDKKNPTLSIRVERGCDSVEKLGEDESYQLRITTSGATLSAANPLGVLHGLETLLQLVETGREGFYVAAVVINDQPRVRWRGLLIDVGRHYIPVEVLKRNIDGMAAVKMNVLHLHLSDDQGFRVESKKFPKLHEMGSDGLYYTQD